MSCLPPRCAPPRCPPPPKSPATCGRTPLIDASHEGKVAVIRELLAHGADIEAREACGDTPLIVSCTHGHAEAAHELLEVGGADVNAINYCSDSTALHQACRAGDVATVRELLACEHIDLEVRDTGGRTALDIAASQPIKDLLRARGARGHGRGE